MGRTSQCSTFGPFFHFQCCDHHSHTLSRLLSLRQCDAGVTQPVREKSAPPSTYSLPMMVALQAAAAQLFRVGDCAGLGDGPVRPDGGVRGARQVRQLRVGRPSRHALLPGVSKRNRKHKEVVNCTELGKRVVPRLRESRLLTPSGRRVRVRVHAT